MNALVFIAAGLLVSSPLLAIAVLWGNEINESRKWERYMEELKGKR